MAQTLAPPQTKSRTDWTPYLFILPALLIIVFISVYPILYGLYLSFTDWYLLKSPDPIWAGLDGYRRLIHDPDLRSALVRTGYWTLGTIVLEYAIGSAAGVAAQPQIPAQRHLCRLDSAAVGDALDRGGLHLALAARQRVRHRACHPARPGHCRRAVVAGRAESRLANPDRDQRLEGRAVHGDRAAGDPEVDSERSLRGGRHRRRKRDSPLHQHHVPAHSQGRAWS